MFHENLVSKWKFVLKNWENFMRKKCYGHDSKYMILSNSNLNTDESLFIELIL